MRVVKVFFIFFVCLSCKKESSLFTNLNSSDSKVDFENTIIEKPKFTILDYLYFYNGGGVSAGDINNDGLVDLYFVSNQGKNKLYLNKGVTNNKPVFEDITEKAGVAGFADWQTGTTMVDVNNDGFLDIYVCAVSNFKGLEGSNELYINNGNGTFTEKSAEYGLDFTGFSTQAAFFDYDKDGDLDCYLLNHAVHNSRSYDRVNTRMLKDNEAGDYFYKNEAGKFVDVSKQAGIYQAAMGYGLGISVADINNDGWEDIYVSNDFHEDDYYYINQKNGTFTEELKSHFKHTSRFSMGSDIADMNNDGFQDIMTLDMYPEDEAVEKSSVGEDPLDIYNYKLQFGYFNQYSRNCLQMNMGGEKFTDVAPLAGVAATDWSWSTLMNDFDNDGNKDIFITNGILRRPNDLDYLKFILADSLHYGLPTSAELDQKAIDLMPSGKVHNYIFKGSADLKFVNQSKDWGFEQKNISNGAAYADLDNDGDWDLITNNLNEAASIFINNTTEKNAKKSNFLKVNLKGLTNKFGIGAKVNVYSNGVSQLNQLMPSRGFMSSVEPSLIFGFGANKIDSLQVIWPSGNSQSIHSIGINKTLVLNEKDALKNNKVEIEIEKDFAPFEIGNKIPFRHKENVYFDFTREFLMPFKVSIEGPKMAVGDVNGDNLEDFYIGGAKYQTGELYLQTANGFIKKNQNVFQADSIFEDVDALFLDIDKDNDLDLYVVSGGNEFFGEMEQQFDRLYTNDGKGNFTKTVGNLPKMFSNKSCVKPFDYDHDGDMDLFVGGRVVPFGYGKTPNSYILENNGKGVFKDVTKQIATEINQVGMVTDAIWGDINGDKKEELTVIGDWMSIKTFEYKNKNFIKTENGIEGKTGFWNGIVSHDFDNDGDLDLIVGNLGTNTKFRKAEDGVLRMYVKDIDKNESLEQIVHYKRNGKYFTIANKDDLGKQMPSVINKRFTTYKNFAGKTINDIFKKAELSEADLLEVNQFESVLLKNNGKGIFEMVNLPWAMQVSKVMTLLKKDINKDGQMDVLVGGNFEGSNMYQARYDGFHGLVMLNDGKANFKASFATQNGLYLEGDIRDLKEIKLANGKKVVVATRNNNTLQWFLGK